MIQCVDLVTDYRKNPVGIDEKRPQFSWKIKSDCDNVMQSAYRIVVEGMWDSGKVESDESVHVEYKGEELEPKTRYNVKVKVWDNYGNESDWTEGFFETAFLGENLWHGHWLNSQIENGEAHVYTRKFFVPGDVKKARIYSTAYGTYEIYINGKKVGDEYLAPGYTSYQKRLQYQVYEAEEYLVEGENIVEITVAQGWAGEFPHYSGHHLKWSPAVLFELSGETDKGEFIVATDEKWECSKSKVVFSSIYDGEDYDASKEDIEMLPFSLDKFGFDNLVAQESEPVKVIETVKAVELIKTPKGETVIDFGQNLVGTVKFKVCGNRGDRVVISHGEILDKDGNFYNENYRDAKAILAYTLSGENDEYHARYTFFGFRYIRIDEYPGEVKLENFEALVMHTDMKRTGYFESSNPLLNRLFLNAIWGQKGNFVDVPTDCPQRDERLGWTGDTQVFCRTGTENFDSALFYRKWIHDLMADQGEDGSCPIIVPKVGDTDRTSSGWSDAAVICPWEVYMTYGDKNELRRCYPSMKKWIEYIKAQGDNPYLWNTGFHYGDWLAMDGLVYDLGGGTSKDFIASAFYAYSTGLIKKAADVLGETEDVEYYGELHKNIIKNINEEFITKTGRVCDNTQTAHALTLYFNLVEDKRRTVENLDVLVTENNNRLSTGFLGTPYLCDSLAENGRVEKAYDLLLGEEYPSWLFSVKMGATTIWEHWDGIKPDGTVWDKSMNSYNHYAYGSIADFMYKKIGGINPEEAGYKKIRIQPLIDSRLECAKTSIDTVYGKVATEWEIKDGQFKICVEIPANTKAIIILPDNSEYNVGSGVYEYTVNM